MKIAPEAKCFILISATVLSCALASRWLHDYIFQIDQDVFFLLRKAAKITKWTILSGSLGAIISIIISGFIVYYYVFKKEYET